MSDTVNEERRRDAIGKTAKTFREAAAKNGHQMTQTDAEARVRRAVTSGDQKRDNNNR